MINCLVITNLFPNYREPNRGLFVKQEIKALSNFCNIKVIAPLPWVPPIKLNSRQNKFTNISATEQIDGTEVIHPRYLVTPKIGRSMYGIFYYLSIIGVIRNIAKNFPINFLYVHYAYPDGFGVALVAKKLKLPYILKVRGSDINLYSKPLLRRRMIKFAIHHAYKIISVSKALNDRVVSLGASSNQVSVIPNGVDTQLFRPIPKNTAKDVLGISHDKIVILFVGHLVALKGVKTLLEAFAKLLNEPDLNNKIEMVIIGDGEDKNSLIQQCHELKINAHVKFVGEQPHSHLTNWFNASDLFCLPSQIEGYPNVIVESLACGVPVVASDVGGIPEIINSPDLGILIEPNNPNNLAKGLHEAIHRNWDRQKISESVKDRSWENVARETFLLFKEYQN